MSSEWQIIQLSKLLSIKPRNGLYKSSDFQGRGSRWIKMKDIYGNDFIKNQPMERILVSEKELDSFGCIEGDLLFGRTSLTLAGVGDCCLIGDVNDVPIFESNLIRIRFNKNIANPKFYYYYFKSKIGKSAIQKIAKQTAAASITGTDLVNISVNYPSLEEQNLICNFLWPLEHRIELLRETNTTLEAIAQALFKSWFVDFDPVHAKQQGRAPEGMDAQTAALFPDSFEESELGMVPKGWRVAKVSEVADVVKGKSYSSKDLVEASSTALVTLKSFERGGGFRMDGFKPYTGNYKPSQVVNAGDLIIAYTDVTQAAELIGKPAVVIGVEEYSVLVASLDVGIVRPNSENIGKQFLYGLFKTENFQSHTLAHTSGTIVLHLAKDGVGSFSFVLPPAELVLAFEKIADAVSERIQTNIDSIRTLASVRDTLLPRLISGQLRLPEAQALVEDGLDA